MRLPIIALAALAAATVDQVSAGMFPPKGAVKMLDSKSYQRTLAEGDIAMVAYVAPWCGHCKNLVPEYTKAAESLSPMVPFYAVDCDAEENKPLCAKEGIKGFPTIKAFPRGLKSVARDYQDERKAGALISYATNLVPDRVKKLRQVEDIEGVFLTEKPNIPHALLLHPSQPSIPLLWKVLAHRLFDKVHLGFYRDQDGAARRTLGIDTGDKTKDGVKVVVWTNDGEKVVYDGALKYDPLMTYLKSISAGDRPTASFTQDSATSTSSTSTTSSKSDAERRAEKRRAMEAKWAEEERRDRLRREKREREKAKKAEEPIEVPQQQEVLESLGVLPNDGGATTSSSAMDSSPTDVGGEADTEQSPSTPLEAVADAADHGKTPVKGVKNDADEGVSLAADDGQSAASPLEEQSEQLEHGESRANEIISEEEAINRIVDEL